MILLISSSQVARITGVSYQCSAKSLDSLTTYLMTKRSPFKVQSVGKLDFSVGGLGRVFEKDRVLMELSLKLLYQLTMDRL
jgi:hypothetical protein